MVSGRSNNVQSSTNFRNANIKIDNYIQCTSAKWTSYGRVSLELHSSLDFK